MYRIILADTIQEANAYARDQGFQTGRFRVASRAAAIRKLRVAEVHQLASFAKRRDRHAVLAELRWAKVPAWFYIDDGWVWPKPPPEPDQGELNLEIHIVDSEKDFGGPIRKPVEAVTQPTPFPPVFADLTDAGGGF